MTESEWLQASDPNALLTFLRGQGRISDRKRRLYACACCRQLWPLMTDRARQAVEAAERYADGRATKADLRRARQAVRAARYEEARTDRGPAFGVCWAAEVVASENGFFWAPDEVARAAAWLPNWADRVRPEFLARLVRDLIANPFQPLPAVNPSWLSWHDGAVGRMARTIYEEARFDDLPILADALEEAGCGSDILLAHCRSGEVHARGCWAVDAILARE